MPIENKKNPILSFSNEAQRANQDIYDVEKTFGHHVLYKKISAWVSICFYFY